MRGGQASLFPFYSSGFTSPDIPSRRQRTKRAHPVLKLWLVTCFWCVLHPKSGFTSQFFFRALWNQKIRRGEKKGSAPTHQTRTTCQKAATLALSQIRHFHTMLTRMPPGHDMCRPSLGNARSHSLAFRQTDSQPGRHTDQCQNTRPAPPVVHLMKSITRTRSLPCLQLESLPACDKIDSDRSCISLFFPECAWSIR